MIWLTIIGIQLLLLVVWLRATKFWWLINKADTFLRKSTLALNQHNFKDDARHIIEKQRPKYSEWKVENFMQIALIFFIFTLLPVIGATAMNGNSSLIINIVLAGMLGVVGYLWNLTKIRVDILNVECDYIDNLVNIVKSDQSALENITE